MRYSFAHTSRYQFDRPVFLEPHLFRLRPREDAAQRVHAFALTICPLPSGQSDQVDAEGNVITQAWFDDLVEALVVETRGSVETLCTNPFDFLLDTSAARLPLAYEPPLNATLAACCARQGDDASVNAFASEVATDAGGDTLGFLFTLCERLYRGWRVLVREEGPPWPAEQTLAGRAGSCRDLAALFNEACRSQGIAARFVSGYQEGDPDQAERHLHAWSEVFLPGAGWLGYDPTHGLAVADRHVALAAAAHPSEAAPVTGTFRGTDARVAFSAELTLSKREG